MSEFQQYQFKTIDDPLTSKQRAYVDSLSSRGDVTNTSAIFTYNYSDFRGDVMELMTKYFDAMCYISNWGSKRLMFRFPQKLVDKKMLLLFETDDDMSSLKFHKSKGVLVLDLALNDESGDWIYEEDYSLGDVISLRDQIINGDYRMLFLAWMSIQQYEVLYRDDEDDEYNLDEIITPPIPPNLKKLNSSLKTFMDWFGVDEDLISAAAGKSHVVIEEKIDYNFLLSKLDNAEKEDFLFRLLNGEHRLDVKLKQQLDSFLPPKPKDESKGVSLLELSKVSKKEEKKRIKKSALAAEKKFIKKMNERAKEEAKLWKEVTSNLNLKIGSSYKKATSILVELKELAAYTNNEISFHEKMMAIKDHHGKSIALMRRFKEAGL